MKKLLVGFAAALAVGGIAGLAAYRQLAAVRAARDAAAAATVKKDSAVTIIEGKRREEIAAQLQEAGITQASEFIAATEGKEGRLFPDTYRFFRNSPAPAIAAAMAANFTRRTEAQPPTAEQLILASIVEREAADDSERAGIAGVYANRLRIGMRLQSDPTVQYAKDTLAGTGPYWGEITRAEYQSARPPFNTYVSDGLPPAPICNPGLKSIRAAVAPAVHEYYFFFHRGGKITYSATLQEHQRKLEAAK